MVTRSDGGERRYKRHSEVLTGDRLQTLATAGVCDYIHGKAHVAEGGCDTSCVIDSVLQGAPPIGVVPNRQGQTIPNAFDPQIALASGAVRAETERQEGHEQSSARVP